MQVFQSSELIQRVNNRMRYVCDKSMVTKHHNHHIFVETNGI